jgi:hypothetical protein
MAIVTGRARSSWRRPALANSLFRPVGTLRRIDRLPPFLKFTLSIVWSHAVPFASLRGVLWEGVAYADA